MTANGGLVAIDFPTGALAQDTEISITTLAGPPLLGGAFAQVGEAYDLSPAGAPLRAPARLSLQYSADALRAARVDPDQPLALAVSRAGSWDLVAGVQTDTATRTVSASVTSLGRYTLVGRRGLEGRIAFSWGTDTDGNGQLTPTDATDIYLAQRDGRGLAPLVALGGPDLAPRFSPSGTHLAFINLQASRRLLYALDLTRPATPRVASGLPVSSDNEAYEWSPDGEHLAYTTQDPETVRVVGPGGAGDRAIANGSHPSWSPDGSEIAFSLANTIRIVPVDGGPARTVTQGSAPRWSSDANRIAFVSSRGGFDAVYVRDLSGSQDILIGEGFGPAWSPSGDALAFPSRLGLRVAETPAGGDPEVHTVGPPHATGPRWSPEGARIAFTTDADSNRDLYVVHRDGSGLAQVTATFPPDQNLDPDWFPVGGP